jgi:MFS family permease
MMVAVAMPWFVLETTGSVLNMGLTAAVVATGSMLSSLAGGPLVDHLGLRRASVISDATAGAAVVAIPALYLAGLLAFWQFLLLAFLISILNPPGDLARRAMIPHLADLAAMPLERANAADTAIPRLAQLAGPILGGILIALAGAANVLFLNAATFFVSAVLVWVGVPASSGLQPELRGEEVGGRDDRHLFANPRLILSHARRYLFDLRQGLGFVLTNGLIVSLAIVATVANLLEKPLMSVVAPLYAEQFYGNAASFGAMLGAFGIGALAGTLLFGVVGHRLPHRLTFVVCLLVAPMFLLGALALRLPLPVVLASVAVAGLIFGPMNTLSATAIQRSTPPAMLGRVFGTITALSMVGVPIGSVLAGVIVPEVGLVPTLFGMCAVYVVLAIVMALNPALRAMDRATPEGQLSEART